MAPLCALRAQMSIIFGKMVFPFFEKEIKNKYKNQHKNKTSHKICCKIGVFVLLAWYAF
jgi:hypothetical protein